ncbi:MAG: Rieske (2Fe-2S) protein, partial [Myxococcota bacterium]
MTTPRWTRVLDAAQLRADHPHTLKLDGKQIVLFRTDPSGSPGNPGQPATAPAAAPIAAPIAATIAAIDNRCPHEGYPLSTGALKDGIVTCAWHNWKFR